MKSIAQRIRAIKTEKMNKRGQTIDLIIGTVIGILVLIFVVFAVLFGIAALNPGNFFPAGSAEQNATNNLRANFTSGVSQFGGQIPTVFIVLGVVLALSAIVILIFYVRRMQSSTGGGGGGL